VSKSNVRFWLKLLLLLPIAIAVGYLLRHDPLFSMIPTALGWVVFWVLSGNILLSVAPKYRRYFWPVSKFCVIVLVLVAAFDITICHFYVRDLKNAKDYVEVIKPRLEEFRDRTGHYPHALTEIAALPSPPAGLTYDQDTKSDGDNYEITYFGSIYSSWTGQWFDDD